VCEWMVDFISIHFCFQEQVQVDFDNLNASTFANFDAGFSCLGTTRDKAGKVSNSCCSLLALKTVLTTC
jgi:hypothetical protein